MLSAKQTIIGLFLLAPKLAFAAGEILTVIAQTDFGEVVPVGGSCVMNPVTGAITPSNLCVGGGTLGHYTITATANTTVRIRAVPTSSGSPGKSFAPTLYLTNNLGANATNLIPDTDIDFNTGSDGIITLYMGGTLTFSEGFVFGSNQTVTSSLEFNEL